MTQQQPFEPKGPAVTEYITYGDKHLAEMRAMDNSGCSKPKEHERWNRFEKVEFLQETTTVEFHTATLLTELISWMPEQDFSKFYDDFCSNWDVCRSHEALDEK